MLRNYQHYTVSNFDWWNVLIFIHHIHVFRVTLCPVFIEDQCYI